MGLQFLHGLEREALRHSSLSNLSIHAFVFIHISPKCHVQNLKGVLHFRRVTEKSIVIERGILAYCCIHPLRLHLICCLILSAKVIHKMKFLNMFPRIQADWKSVKRRQISPKTLLWFPFQLGNSIILYRFFPSVCHFVKKLFYETLHETFYSVKGIQFSVLSRPTAFPSSFRGVDSMRLFRSMLPISHTIFVVSRVLQSHYEYKSDSLAVLFSRSLDSKKHTLHSYILLLRITTIHTTSTHTWTPHTTSTHIASTHIAVIETHSRTAFTYTSTCKRLHA